MGRFSFKMVQTDKHIFNMRKTVFEKRVKLIKIHSTRETDFKSEV